MKRPPDSRIRLWLSLVALGLFSSMLRVNAQAPVIIGDRDLNVLGRNEAFDPSSNTWSTKAEMPTERYNISTAVVQGKIYVIGGECCTISCTPMNTVEIYDPSNDTWTAGTPLPFPPRWDGAAGVMNGIIYYVGGQTGCGEDVNTNEAFDPATNLWSTKASMPTARHRFGVAVVFRSDLGHEVLYAIGGQPFGGQTDAVEMYNPITDTWSTKAPMPTARYGLHVAAVNGKIYAIGGSGVGGDCDPQSGACHIVEEYDPVSNTWSTGHRAPIPTYRGPGPAAVGVVNGIIYVAGGSNNNRQLSLVETYDPLTDTWSTVPPMPTGRDSLAGAVIQNTFYAIGGILSGGAATVGQPFIYQITATNHPTSYDASDLPPGLDIDHATGLIFGVPTMHVYDAVAQISATNEFGTGFSEVTLSVQDAPPPFDPSVSTPMIVSSTSVTGRTNRPFRFQILTKDASEGERFTAGGLPAGLTIDSLSGLISGTPTSDGNFLVSVSVTDQQAIATGILQMTFLSDPTIPILTSTTQPGGNNAVLVPGQYFTRTLTADASNSIFTYIGTDGQEHQGQTSVGLPPGLSFDGVATISGIYSPPTPTPGIDPVNGPISPLVPDTIKIRPLFVIEPIATNANGTGVAPLDFIEPTPTPSGFPSAPVARAGTFVASNSFTANWNSVSGATGYRCDVSTSSSFTSYVPGYQNLNVGNVTTRSVTGLNPSTTYYYRVRAYNGVGTSGNSNIITIRTLAASGAPVAITNPASSIASFSARVNGSLDPHGLSTTVSFRYGTTTNYGRTTTMQTRNGNMYQNIAANISDLTPNTVYHYRIVATNNGGTRFGSDRTFTTLSATGPPVVATNPATNLTSSAATLNGSLDPHGLATTVFFRWGTTTSYGHTTPMQTQSGNTFRNIAANITGLSTHTTYHFRIVATNNAGTRLGSDRVFTTP